MTHVITSPCLESRHQSCLTVCPVDCIYDVDRMFVIHPDECIDCGACVPECPVDAIYADADLPADQNAFVAINAGIVAGEAAARTALDAALAEPG